MNREEIKYASKDYVNYILDKQEYHNEIYTEYDIREAFEKGAMFGYNNPYLSSLWHDASEEPKHGEDIIAICDTIPVAGVFTKHLLGKGIFRYHCLLCDWYSPQKWETVDKWAYIKDLLPKECEKLQEKRKEKMDSIIENIEQNAAKYDNNKENFKERFLEVSNKCNDLYKLNNDSLKKHIDLSVEYFLKHQELMDSLESIKPISLNKNEVANNFETMYNESERVYNKDYSTGEYCHEQSFKWGFQEGFDFAMKLFKGE